MFAMRAALMEARILSSRRVRLERMRTERSCSRVMSSMRQKSGCAMGSPPESVRAGSPIWSPWSKMPR